MSQLMKSVSGIRGIVGDSLTTELVLSFAKRFGVFSGRGKVVVGRDSRTTGKMLLYEIALVNLRMSSGIVIIYLDSFLANISEPHFSSNAASSN